MSDGIVMLFTGFWRHLAKKVDFLRLAYSNFYTFAVTNNND
jgi:hypothetical protein